MAGKFPSAAGFIGKFLEQPSPLTRRSFLSGATLLTAACLGPASGSAMDAGSGPSASSGSGTAIPVGLELYSVREELSKDASGTVRAVAKMGYQCVEFYAPYFEWSEAQTKDMKKLLDELGVHCYSTHNDHSYFAPDKLSRARDLNLILGCKYMVMASSTGGNTLDSWKAVAQLLNHAAEQLEPSGLKAGYHNHQPEFRVVEGKRPMEVLAAETRPSVMLQLDVGTCLESGADPIAWIRSNPGRVRSIHCKDWSAQQGYAVLFGEGSADWKGIFQAAEANGVEYYLIEQEGSRYPELETVQRCLESFRTTRRA